MIRPRPRHRGFSIVEVLISFTILVSAILALLGLMPVAAKQQTSSDMQNRALQMAQQYMDEILMDPAQINTAVASTAGFNVTRTSIPSPISATNPSNVTVSVVWLENQGGATVGASQGVKIRRVTLNSVVSP